jgi:CheY-like chemotaxis protein
VSRILVADDDPDQLAVTKALLECLGHEVVVAECPSEALRELERSAPGLFLMDLRFPNAAGQPDSREGMALIRRIREAGYRLPVVVLSGWPEDLYGEPEEEMVSRIMVKPVEIPVLLETIAELTSVSAPSRNLP